MINEKSPERRNLILISFFTILYHASGASITTDSINMPLITVRIQKPFALEIAYWFVFVYCIYRFWLDMKDGFKSRFMADARKESTRSKYFVEIIKRESGINQYERESGRYIPSLRYIMSEIISLSDDIEIRRLSNDGIKQKPELIKVDYSKMSNELSRIKFVLSVCFKYRCFSDDLFPYIMAVLAIALNIISKF